MISDAFKDLVKNQIEEMKEFLDKNLLVHEDKDWFIHSRIDWMHFEGPESFEYLNEEMASVALIRNINVQIDPAHSSILIRWTSREDRVDVPHNAG